MSTHSCPHRSAWALLALVVAILALIGAISVLAAPRAFAHDALAEASPADGAVLDQPPQEVVLTFTGELLEMNPAIIVSDSSGQSLTDNSLRIDAQTATLPLPDLVDGDYQVDWSVVSSDGHRIQGSYEFSVEAAQESEQSQQVPEEDNQEETAQASPSADQTPTPEPDTDSAAGQEPADSGGLPTWTIIVLALVVLGAAVAALTARRKQ